MNIERYKKNYRLSDKNQQQDVIFERLKTRAKNLNTSVWRKHLSQNKRIEIKENFTKNIQNNQDTVMQILFSPLVSNCFM